MRPNALVRLVEAGIVTCALLRGFAPAGATEIVTEVSFPAVFEFAPPADHTLEGSRTVTAHADGAVWPIEDYAWLTTVDLSTYTTVFRWHETAPRLAFFTDAADETLRVVFAPTSVMPLDLARHDLPVLHLQTDPAGLWDQDIGIYVWGQHDNFLQRGEAWERAATLDYYEADGDLAFSEPIGLRINGESSREYAQKGLRLYFDDYGDIDYVEHDFFGDGPVRCERLVLRGNRYADFAIGSGMMEPLHQELGHPGSRWSYVGVYVNDEYWGAYSLRERFDAKWVETTHEWADDDYVIIKDHEAEAGEYGRWEQVLAGCQPPANPAAHAWFQWLESELDLASYLDWILINASGMTADNMAGKNLAILKVGGQPFRYMTWDEDILFQTANRDADHFSFYAAGDAAEFVAHRPPAWYSGGPWDFTFCWNDLLRAGMQNAEFKARLRERAAALLAGPLSAADLDARLTDLATRQSAEWVHHDLRWNAPGTYAGKVASVRANLAYRAQKVAQLAAAFLATWADPVELTALSVVCEDAGRHLAWHTEREVDCLGWIIERSVGTPDDFTAIATWVDHPELASGGGPDLPHDYTWVDASAVGSSDLYYRLAHADAGGATVVHDWVEHVGLPTAFTLRLNEVLADNDGVHADEAGEYDDWVEIVNIGSAPVALGGLYLTDNLDNPTKWIFPALELAPGGFALIWCDEDGGQGPLHANFKLSADGEDVGLFASVADGNLPIDTLVFGTQTTDVSLARAVDGTGPWVLCPTPTPNTSNTTLTPVTPMAVGDDALRLGRPWPNPTATSLQVAGRLPAASHPATLRVFDARGALVRDIWSGVADATAHTWTWDGRDTDGRPSPAGVYVLRLQAGAQVRQQRVVRVK